MIKLCNELWSKISPCSCMVFFLVFFLLQQNMHKVGTLAELGALTTKRALWLHFTSLALGRATGQDIWIWGVIKFWKQCGLPNWKAFSTAGTAGLSLCWVPARMRPPASLFWVVWPSPFLWCGPQLCCFHRRCWGRTSWSRQLNYH